MDFPALQRAARRHAAAELLRHAASELDRITSGRRTLHAVRHPRGFVCLPVLREGEDGVCVHVFGTEPEQDGPPGQEHCHSWDLTSTVLYGRICNHRIDVADDATAEPTHRVFEVLSDPSGVDRVRPTERLVRPLPGAEQTSTRGQTYALPAGEFHTTRVPDGRPTATLVLGRTLPGRVDLSLGPMSAPGHRMVRRTCDATETARIARATLRRIHEPEP
jgi:hypothetical protein